MIFIYQLFIGQNMQSVIIPVSLCCYNISYMRGKRRQNKDSVLKFLTKWGRKDITSERPTIFDVVKEILKLSHDVYFVCLRLHRFIDEQQKFNIFFLFLKHSTSEREDNYLINEAMPHASIFSLAYTSKYGL